MSSSKLRSILLAPAIVGGAVGLASNAQAQGDVNVPPPNVLLLVDTSGSMEYRSTTVGCPVAGEPCFPKCFPAETNPLNHEKSRWIELVEVLTGSIQGYSCYAHDRSQTDFEQEYELPGSPVVKPYDLGYSNPYHRPQSDPTGALVHCTPGAGTLPPDNQPYLFPSDFVKFRPFSSVLNQINYSPLADCAALWQQSGDGLLDAFSGQIRFGLMTFDTHTDPSRGYDTGGALYNQGVQGTWSYYLDTNCQVIPGGAASNPYCSGKPENCSSEFPQEVGARNAYAPPWEGRMVAFGPSNAGGPEVITRNQWIQDVLLTTRPYGATPIAGLMADAREFLWDDTTDDPLNPGTPFGPANDPLVQTGTSCRQNNIILLSDGEPNLDLRPHCETGDGICPYDTPENIADAMITDANAARRVRTYVIGFAVTEVTPFNHGGPPIPCEDLPTTTPDYCALTAPEYVNDRELQACCKLNEIALNGTPPADRSDPNKLNHALFAKDPIELRDALAEVLGQTLSAVTGRTQPVFASGDSASGAASFEFRSGVGVRTFALWEAKLERIRVECDTQTNLPVRRAFDPTAGDDFIENVNSGQGPARRFFSVEAETVSNLVHSDWSIRPRVTTTNDGVGIHDGQRVGGGDNASFVGDVTAPMMSVQASDCNSQPTPNDCKNEILRWLVGMSNGTQYHRCAVPGSADCSLVGDIFHATPQVVSKPTEFLRDETYAQFQREQLTRDTILYTSTNDGFFHGFKVAPGDLQSGTPVNQQENNEVWAFIPPAVLPHISSSYPGTRLPLLDGVPVIKDVVAVNSGQQGPANEILYNLERAASDAEAGQGSYRTIMVSSFGKMQGGYFAVDITNPNYDTNDAGNTGPQFLWQLTKNTSNQPIFGNSGATPLITTVFMNTGAPTEPIREVAVAVLPGGDGDGIYGGGTTTNTGNHMTVTTTGYGTPRPSIRDYAPGSDNARSLTIVRLDTGEIIRSFRQGPLGGHPIDDAVITPIDIPAPIVGTPAAFPAQTGAVADRIFVGDREGRIWRIDVSDTNPANWVMEVFFDVYTGLGPNDGQPLVTPPVLSVDDAGNITVAASTGDQEVLTATGGMKNFVISLTEVLVGGQFQTQLNWREHFDNGDRVSGPMSLFDKTLFFSSFTPDAGGACEVGESSVWGVHYLDPQDTNNIELGGAAALPDTANPGTFIKKLQPKDGVVFGVGLTQLPTCTVQETVFSGDPYLGFGQVSSTSISNPGKFQLQIQIGGSDTGDPTDGTVKTESIDLDPPAQPVTIDSWAAIVE